MIHERIQQKLKEQNLKQADIARATGKSTAAVAKWLNGQNIPKSNSLIDIANLLGVSQEWLLTGQGKMTDTPFDNTPNDLFDDKLIHQAIQLSGLNQSEVINQALQLFIAFQEEQRSIKAQEELKKLRGKLHWEGDLKQMRSHFDDECA